MERPVSPGVIASSRVAGFFRSDRGRVQATRGAVSRLKHAGVPPVIARGPDAISLALLAGALLCSAALGFVAGSERRPAMPDDPPLVAADARSRPDNAPGVPSVGAARADAVAGEADAGSAGRGAVADALPDDDRPVGGAPDHARPASDSVWSELGRVRAEILRLRVLFVRLADVAGLDDGEFDLDLPPSQVPTVGDATSARDALDELSRGAIEPLAVQSARMARIFDDRRAAHDRRVGGQLAVGIVRTSGFGYRASPLSGRRQMHHGVDYAGPVGTPLHALADGVVTWSGRNGGYGNLVEIEHGAGYRTRYAHNQSNLVALGDRVRKGEAIATLGSSGRSTGPHVHVEVRRHGAPLDPALYVR